MNAKLQALPLGERIKLVEDIWDSIAAEQATLTLTPEQRAELDLQERALGMKSSSKDWVSGSSMKL